MAEGKAKLNVHLSLNKIIVKDRGRNAARIILPSLGERNARKSDAAAKNRKINK